MMGGHGPGSRLIHPAPLIGVWSLLVALLLLSPMLTEPVSLQVGFWDGHVRARRIGPITCGPPPLTLTITERGFSLSAGMDQLAIASTASGFNFAELDRVLTMVRTNVPDIMVVKVRPADGIAYETLVRVIDVTVGAGFGWVMVHPVNEPT